MHILHVKTDSFSAANALYRTWHAKLVACSLGVAKRKDKDDGLCNAEESYIESAKNDSEEIVLIQRTMDVKTPTAQAMDEHDRAVVGVIELLSVDKALERRVVRKPDLQILPWICSAYLINCLDRVNLGNARTLNNDVPEDNIVQQLGMTGNRYSIAVAVFFVPFPSNILLKYFSPRVWIGRIMISWGVVTLCTTAVSSYIGLLVVRFFLGLAEAGFLPGVIMYLCFWYPPHERATRMAIFAGSVAVAGEFLGLLASGIGFMNGVGGLEGRKWLFIWTGRRLFVMKKYCSANIQNSGSMSVFLATPLSKCLSSADGAKGPMRAMAKTLSSSSKKEQS